MDVRWARAPGGSSDVGPIRTVEHLLAAVVAAGITDLWIDVRGREIPALDGSAAVWREALGRPVETGVTWGWRVERPLFVEGHGGWARVRPFDGLRLIASIDFGPGLRQTCSTNGGQDVLGARTFVPHHRLDALVAAGHGRGIEPGSIVVWGPRGSLVPLRHADEPARHKALDLLGDLALLGLPLEAEVEVHRGSHALHQQLVRELRASLRWRSRSG